MAPVNTLADDVLPLIRTRADLWRRSTANDNAHGLVHARAGHYPRRRFRSPTRPRFCV